MKNEIGNNECDDIIRKIEENNRKIIHNIDIISSNINLIKDNINRNAKTIRKI